MRLLLCVLVACATLSVVAAQTYKPIETTGAVIEGVYLLMTTQAVMTSAQIASIESASGAVLSYNFDYSSSRVKLSLVEFSNITNDALFFQSVATQFPDWNGSPHESIDDVPPLSADWLVSTDDCSLPTDLPSVIVAPNVVIGPLEGGLSSVYSPGLSTVDCLPWDIDRIDQTRGTDREIHAQLSGVGVSVYVVDSGVKSDHVEFSNPNSAGNRLSRVIDDWSFPFDTKQKEETADDCNGHGTSVAAIAAGARVGLAFESSVRSVKVLDCDARGDATTLTAGLLHILGTHVGPSVVNLGLESRSSEIIPAWMILKLLHCDGVVVVAGAGNDDVDACNSFPGLVPSVLSVAATDINDQRASFSNFGECVSLFAPGVSSYTAHASGSTNYRSFSGTSASAPLVSAAVALYLQMDPTASPAQVHFALLNASSQNVVIAASGSPNRLLMVLPWAESEPDFGPIREYASNSCSKSRTTSRAVIIITAVVFSVAASLLILLMIIIMTWQYIVNIKTDKLYEPPKVVPKMQRQLTKIMTSTSLNPDKRRDDDDDSDISTSSSPAFRPSTDRPTSFRPGSERPTSTSFRPGSERPNPAPKEKGPAVVVSDDGAISGDAELVTPKKEHKKKHHK